MNLKTSILELLSEIIESQVEPALTEIPFRNPADIRLGLEYLAEEIESLDANEIFTNLAVNPSDYEDEGED